MKRFEVLELPEAISHAAEGGQALHLHRIIVDERRAPRCFVDAVRRGEDIAHLFDQDYKRLCATGRKLGVRVIVVEHEGEEGQHIDLCGGPLRKALALCEPEGPCAGS